MISDFSAMSTVLSSRMPKTASSRASKEAADPTGHSPNSHVKFGATLAAEADSLTALASRALGTSFRHPPELHPPSAPLPTDDLTALVEATRETPTTPPVGSNVFQLSRGGDHPTRNTAGTSNTGASSTPSGTDAAPDGSEVFTLPTSDKGKAKVRALAAKRNAEDVFDRLSTTFDTQARTNRSYLERHLNQTFSERVRFDGPSQQFQTDIPAIQPELDTLSRELGSLSTQGRSKAIMAIQARLNELREQYTNQLLEHYDQVVEQARAKVDQLQPLFQRDLEQKRGLESSRYIRQYTSDISTEIQQEITRLRDTLIDSFTTSLPRRLTTELQADSEFMTQAREAISICQVPQMA